MKQTFFDDFKNIDKTTVLIFLIMVFWGWLNIYAAGYKESHQNILDLSQNYGKQFIWIIAALILGFAVLLLDTKVLMTFAYPIFGTTLLILIIVLLFGTEINSSKSWFQIGGFNIQPSEFAKFATAIALGKFISNNKNKTINFKQRAKTLAIIFIPFALILLQNDAGTALVFSAFIFMLYREGIISGLLLTFAAAAALLFVLTLILNEFIIIGGLAVITVIASFILRSKKKEILMVIGLFLVMSSYVYTVDYAFENFLQPHQKNRIEVLIDSKVDPLGAGYNLNQSKIAIGSGGLWGKGFLSGTQTKLDFVPEQSTDFIFCTIGEEWGWVGSLTLIFLYMMLIIRIIVIAEKQRAVFSRIFGYCLAGLLFFHFAINIGMTIGLMPVIGIPLPFFSYGGSSLLAFTVMIFAFLKLDAKRLELL
jgi:rod shape determining protein RodA